MTKRDLATEPDFDPQIKAFLKKMGEAIRQLTMGGQDYECWLTIGHSYMAIIDWVVRRQGLKEWDGDNKHLTREVTWRFAQAWHSLSNKELPSKVTRMALRELMTNEKIRDWRNSLPWEQQLRLNHPRSIVQRYRALSTERPLGATKTTLRIDLETAIEVVAKVLAEVGETQQRSILEQLTRPTSFELKRKPK